MHESPKGLKDGGHVLVECSNCRAILLDVWITRPHEKETWKVRASCPFCGDESFPVTVKGGFHVGGYGQVKEDDPDSDWPSTVIDKSDIRGDLYYFKVIKATPDAKPIKKRS